MHEQPFTLTLTRIPTETQEEYAQRCQNIANYARSKITQVKIDHFTRVTADETGIPVTSTAITFDASNTSGYKQVGEHAYEIVTPGYQLKEKSENERDTHFADFARLLFERLKPDLAMLLMEVNRNKPDAIEKAEHIIQGVMAEALYDFAQHAINHMRDCVYDLNIPSIEDIPDITTWPEEE